MAHFARGGSPADYPSASSPGYYLLLAPVDRLSGGSLAALRWASALITVALAVWMARRLRPYGDGRDLALLLPVVLSVYFLPAGVWLAPDNLSWLLALVVWWRCFRRGADTVQGAAVLGGLLALAFLVRQNNLWLLAPAAWACLALPQGKAPRRGLRMALVLLPPLLTAAVMLAWWHGLTPPSSQARHVALNASAPVFVLAVIGFYGFFFTPLWLPAFLEEWIRRGEALRRWLLAGGVIALVWALLPHTNWDRDAGRWSGLWEIARVFPAPLGRSPVIVGCAVLGGLLIAFWLRLLNRYHRGWLLLSGAAFVAAQSVNTMVYERYDTVWVLALILLVALATRPRLSASRTATAGALFLALFNLAVLVRTLFFKPPLV